MANLIDVLEARAGSHPDRPAYLFLRDGRVVSGLTFREFHSAALRLASGLSEWGREGDRLLLLLPTGPDFLLGLLACMLTARVAIPAYPPTSRRSRLRLAAIARDAGARRALIPSPSAGRTPAPGDAVCDLSGLECRTTEELGQQTLPAAARAAAPDSLALLQYTSGSTGSPKGVMISHDCLFDNERQIAARFGHTSDTIILLWLPLFHDMGPVGALQAIYAGCTCYLMSPGEFLEDPAAWLRAIAQFKVSTSGGPDFAFAHCVRRVPDDACRGLDLRAWRIAFNGSEPVRAETMRAFAAKFAPYGFSPRSFLPCYGLAEATLMVAGCPPAAGAREIEVERETPGTDQSMALLRPGSVPRRLVSCGHPVDGTVVAIVDPDTRDCCPDGRVGEVWVSGPNLARGYWNRGEETARTFAATTASPQLNRDAFLRTGDLGFVKDGELFLVGRLKDVIIIRGTNHYAEDIEHTADRCHPRLVPGGVAAFAIENEGAEQLVLAAETDAPLSGLDAEAICRAVRSAVSEAHLLETHAIVFVRKNSLPRTSSGKLQRHKAREQYITGSLVRVTLREARPGEPGQEPYPAPAPPGPPPHRSPALEAVRGVVQAVLGEMNTDLDDDVPLPALGFDSLRCVTLESRLKAELALVTTLESLLGGATIASLADLAGRADAISQEPSPGPALGGDEDAAEVTGVERGLWYVQQETPGCTAYNVNLAFRLLQPAEPALLETALRAVVARHATLRSTYRSEGDRILRQQQPVESVSLEVIDLGGETADNVRAMLRELGHRPFELQKGPVFRASLVRCGQGPVLLLSVHHVAVDLWSMGIVVAEFLQTYVALSSGREPLLPPPRRSYDDFVSWQRGLLAGGAGSRLLRSWKEAVPDDVPPLNWPGLLPRHKQSAHAGGTYPFRLGIVLSLRLRGLAQERGVTLFAMLFAAYQAFIYLNTGQERFVAGTAVAGRSRPEFDCTVGCFANVLPICAGIDPAERFSSLARRTARRLGHALAHQDMPYPTLAAQTVPERQRAQRQLFETLFVGEQIPPGPLAELRPLLEGEEGRTLNLFGLSVEPVLVPRWQTEFPLIVRLLESGGELRGSFDYQSDSFSPSLVEELAQRFGVLLEQLARQADPRVGELHLCTPEEVRLLRSRWSGEEADYAPPQAFPALFAGQASRTPDRVALTDYGRQLTYAELDCRSSGFACELSRLGVRPGDFVGVCAGRSGELIEAMLGVLKAGAVLVPLDPTYPQSRLGAMVEDSKLTVVCAQPGLDVRLDGVLVLWPAAPPHEGVSDPLVQVPVSQGAYVMWTSGTTGRPKGVLVSHRSLHNHIHNFARALSLRPEDVVLQFSPSSFDAVVEEVFPALASGAALAVCPPSVADCLTSFTAFLDERQVTVANLPTPFWQLWMGHLAERGAPVPGCLRAVVIGNVRVPPGAVEAWFRLPNAENVALLNAYGPTETTVTATLFRIPAPALGPAEVPIGRPLPNVRAYVLDKNMNFVPPGMTGELYLGGPGVSYGYVNRPDQTAAAFLPDPFAGEPGARLYRTGDLVRHLPDGNLEYVGRTDDQVKVHGFRVELSDVESTLRQHGAVQSCAVLLREGPHGSERLAAFVTPRPGTELSPGEVRQFLSDRLPRHMVPGELHVRPSLPVTATGKIDRQALLASTAGHKTRQGAGPAPAGIAAAQIAELWAEVLELGARPTTDDHFFDLGGHSLSAIRLISKLKDCFGVDMPLATVFELPTLAEQARWLEETLTADVEGLSDEELRRLASND
jgi:amino acid adenylation domain-containing protein